MSNRPRPAHARALLSKGSIASLLAMAWLAPAVACGGDDGDGGKPSATIVFPRVDVWTPQSTGRVRGTAVAPPSRTIVQLLVNGDPAKTTNGYADWTVDVTLEPGPNPLTVVVTDSEGEVSTTTGVTVTSNKPMRDIVSEQVLVKDGLVYAADVSEVVTIPVDGGPRKSLVTLGTDAVHHFAIDGATLYLVSRSGTFGSVPVTGGALTPIGKVQPNQRAMAVAGGKLVLLGKFGTFGGPAPAPLISYPLTGGFTDFEFVPVTHDPPIDFEIADFDVADGSFYLALTNRKALVVPATGGAVTELDISLNTGGGEVYPKLIKVSAGKVYVSFDESGSSWYTAPLAGGALTPLPLKLPADAAPYKDVALDGDFAYVPALFGGVERAPLAGGASQYVSDNDIADYAYAGTADATDVFITTPKGVTAYTRATFEKRLLYTWPALDENRNVADDFAYTSVATSTGGSLFVAQGDKVHVIEKASGTGKVLVQALQSKPKDDPATLYVATALSADEKNLFVRTPAGFEVYDVSTGAFVKTILFEKPGRKSPTVPLASDASFFYTVSSSDAVARVKKDTSVNFLVAEPFGTPPITSPTGIVLERDELWVLNAANKLFRMPVDTGTATEALDGSSAGFSSAGQQLLAVGDGELAITINGNLARVMITEIASGASYYLH